MGVYANRQKSLIKKKRKKIREFPKCWPSWKFLQRQRCQLRDTKYKNVPSLVIIIHEILEVVYESVCRCLCVRASVVCVIG